MTVECFELAYTSSQVIKVKKRAMSADKSADVTLAKAIRDGKTAAQLSILRTTKLQSLYEEFKQGE